MSEKMMDEFNAICESDLWSWMNEDQKLAAYSLWQSAWQASRAALVVELPANCKGMALTVDELRTMLGEIGVTLK